ncbi:hypothetical protein WOLCODRAFT_161917 [Wolfiporia cocos MD-104 SS10]|uniref:Uncharacterized protein n=1 Tax=Wolfiporia cocos (strain MD-104) TaxID=742152 RepID=A0A2H3JUN2_WOLCO|nr:hypothetical protein WOLCODRAFT_161917 [Wolfiporia cocos MD-104 SS10]
MPWPLKVVRQFEMVPANPSEADFHGPYNKLLHTLFPTDTDFTVVPFYSPNLHDSADFVTFAVLIEDRPVFIIKLRPPSDLRYASSRETADRQIRAHIKDIHGDCSLPVLHAVSAMGTRLCFYQKPQVGPVQPPFIETDPSFESDTAPRERWDCDILEEEGMQRIQAVVEDIKQGCAVI